MESSESSQQRGRILLVDDEADLGEALTRVLCGKGGFDVVHELSSETALRHLQTGSWDPLITDIELPGMSGLDLLEHARQVAPGLPVAVLTGHPTVDYAVSALRNSAAEFLQKPIAPRDLIAKAAAPRTRSEQQAVTP